MRRPTTKRTYEELERENELLWEIIQDVLWPEAQPEQSATRWIQ